MSKENLANKLITLESDNLCELTPLELTIFAGIANAIFLSKDIPGNKRLTAAVGNNLAVSVVKKARISMVVKLKDFGLKKGL